MTFEQIAKANESIKTTDIKGKAYAEVNQRIKAFRMVYPAGFIITDMVSNENGVCVFKASVGYYAEDGNAFTLGTGSAYEKESSSFINKTSYIENCETSAVGRALGMAGFGIDTSVASYEEVANAIENQKKPSVKMASAQDVAYIANNCTDEQIQKLLKMYGIEQLEELMDKQAKNIVLKLNARKMEETEI